MLPRSLSCVPSSKSPSSPLTASDIKSSSESMIRGGDAGSEIGVLGACNADASLRDLVDPGLLSLGDSIAFLFLVWVGVVCGISAPAPQ